MIGQNIMQILPKFSNIVKVRYFDLFQADQIFNW
jgi:hypothetical protein